MTDYEIVIYKMAGAHLVDVCRYKWTVKHAGFDLQYWDSGPYRGTPIPLQAGVVKMSFASTKWGARKEARKAIRRIDKTAQEVERFKVSTS